MTQKKVCVAVSTRYESLDAEQIESVEFLEAVEAGLGNEYAISERDRSLEYFFVDLGFSQIDEDVTAVSAVIGFHESSTLSDADYFLRQYTGYFRHGDLEETAYALVNALKQEISRRRAEGWWEE